MGRGHLDNYVKFLKEDSPIQIVALCDVDEKKFTNYKADFNLGEVGADGYDFNMFRLYNDLDKMLEAETDLDMVTIALPTYLHCWGACKCMEKGINVLSEKPMALTVEQCEEMIACAKKNNVSVGAPLPLGYDQYTNNTYGNKQFIENAISYLIDGEGLINVRSRDLKIRLLDINKINNNTIIWQVLNVVLPSALMVLLGVLLAYIRKKKYTK